MSNADRDRPPASQGIPEWMPVVEKAITTRNFDEFAEMVLPRIKAIED